MKTIGYFVAVILFCALIVHFPASAAAQEASAESPLVDGQRMLYERVMGYIIRSAEKMPEEKFSFKPVPEVRSFGQILGHVADTQYLFCSPIQDQEFQSLNIEQTTTKKTELIQALRDAFSHCGEAYNSMTDAKAVETGSFFGGDQEKLTLMSFNTSHINEHYGNLVTYMRINGLVPPSSEPRSKPKR